MEIYILAALIAAYLLGSIPFGILIAKAFGLGDLRKIGSGNIGATNVLRTGNKGAALATLLLDAAKGAVAVIVARAFGGEMLGLLAGMAAFLGHLYPVWLKFQGGKGMATFLGMMLALMPLVGLAACATWLAVAAIWRFSSLAALVSAAAVPVMFALAGRFDAAGISLLMVALIWWRHRANIARLRAGTETRIGAEK